jgi:ribonucleoside-triphosphate reductase
MTDRKSIEARIAELKGQLGNAEGTPTEVYSRIVGYYRSVRNWNAGKREEYGQRIAYGMPADMPSRVKADAEHEPARAAEPSLPAASAPPSMAAAPTVAAPTVAAPTVASLRDGVLVFTREACPNCPPVANYVVASGMKAVFVDVDREEGLALARDLGVLATPTVLALDGDGHESFRAFDLKGLRNRLEVGSTAGA